jgi:hypothetical protein
MQKYQIGWKQLQEKQPKVYEEVLAGIFFILGLILIIWVLPLVIN